MSGSLAARARIPRPIYGLLNDLWQYNPLTNQWTWMSGSNTAAGAIAVSGTLGSAAQSNQPAGRAGALGWTDAKGNFWLFGGIAGPPNNQTGYLSNKDLWEYTPSTHQWTWVGGSDAANQPGNYGAVGKSDAANVPGARSYAISWTDLEGNFLAIWRLGRRC